MTAKQLFLGSRVSLQNMFSLSAGYLVTLGDSKTVSFYSTYPVDQMVFTLPSQYSSDGCGLWYIVSAEGKSIGAPLSIGEKIHLKSCNRENVFLTTCQYVKNISALSSISENIVVFTSRQIDTRQGSSTWIVQSAIGKKNGDPVESGDDVHLRDCYPNGGFLDVFGESKTIEEFKKFDAKLMVFTSSSNNRSGKSGTWRIKSEENLMLSINSGRLTAPHTHTYEDSINQNVFLRAILKPASAGCVVHNEHFFLELKADGKLRFGVFIQSLTKEEDIDKKISSLNTATRKAVASLGLKKITIYKNSIVAVSSKTTIINDGKTHVISCVAPLKGTPTVGGMPKIFLDGANITDIKAYISLHELNFEPSPHLVIGNNAYFNDQYTGGIMNLGIWYPQSCDGNFTPPASETIDDFLENLVAFWSFNGSLHDYSQNINKLDAQANSKISYSPAPGLSSSIHNRQGVITAVNEDELLQYRNFGEWRQQVQGSNYFLGFYPVPALMATNELITLDQTTSAYNVNYYLTEGYSKFGTGFRLQTLKILIVGVDFKDCGFTAYYNKSFDDFCKDMKTKVATELNKQSSKRMDFTQAYWLTHFSFKENWENYFDYKSKLNDADPDGESTYSDVEVKQEFFDSLSAKVSGLGDLITTSDYHVIVIATISKDDYTAPYFRYLPITIDSFDIYPIILYQECTENTLVHEIGHALGLPDLYAEAGDTSTVGAWDYMSKDSGASNFLGWHRHKLLWSISNSKRYIGDKKDLQRQSGKSEDSIQFTLIPLNNKESRSWLNANPSLIVLCNSDDPRAPSEVIAIEIAQQCTDYPSPNGLLIYTVDANKGSGESPVVIQKPPNVTDVEKAIWDENSGTFSARFFKVKVIGNAGDKWTVKITYDEMHLTPAPPVDSDLPKRAPSL